MEVIEKTDMNSVNESERSARRRKRSELISKLAAKAGMSEEEYMVSPQFRKLVERQKIRQSSTSPSPNHTSPPPKSYGEEDVVAILNKLGELTPRQVYFELSDPKFAGTYVSPAVKAQLGKLAKIVAIQEGAVVTKKKKNESEHVHKTKDSESPEATAAQENMQNEGAGNITPTIDDTVPKNVTSNKTGELKLPKTNKTTDPETSTEGHITETPKLKLTKKKGSSLKSSLSHKILHGKNNDVEAIPSTSTGMLGKRDVIHPSDTISISNMITTSQVEEDPTLEGYKEGLEPKKGETDHEFLSRIEHMEKTNAQRRIPLKITSPLKETYVPIAEKATSDVESSASTAKNGTLDINKIMDRIGKRVRPDMSTVQCLARDTQGNNENTQSQAVGSDETKFGEQSEQAVVGDASPTVSLNFHISLECQEEDISVNTQLEDPIPAEVCETIYTDTEPISPVSSTCSDRTKLSRNRNKNVKTPVGFGRVSEAHETTNNHQPQPGSAPLHDNLTTSNRIDNTLRIVYPLISTITCTEAGCSFKSWQKTWSNKKQALKRHLVQVHRLNIEKIERWCGLCNSSLDSLVHVSRHPCLKEYDPLVTNEDNSGSFKCQTCNEFSTDNMKALKNHIRIHQRNTARTRATANSAHNSQALSQTIASNSLQSGNETEALTNINLDNPITLTADSGIGSGEVLDADDEDDSQICQDSEDPYPSEIFIEPLQDILNGYTPERWQEFEDIVKEITEHAQVIVNLPDLQPNNGFKSSVNPKDPSAIQRLYRRNRRRAIRTIREEKQSFCKVSHQDLQQNLFTHEEVIPDLEIYKDKHPATSPVDLSPFILREVRTKLYQCENSAPGPDRLTYDHLRSYDGDAKVLTLLFNICRTANDIPKLWKETRTILIPKDGDPALASSWRPIALTSTLYRLFAGLLCKRLTRWMETNQVLSPNQKGYRPFDGTLENNYEIHAQIANARRQRKQMIILLIDIKNAFGSIPHVAMIEALRKAGVGAKMKELIDKMYKENVTRLVTDEGTSDPIPQTCGVKQGCPLSGPVFNVTIDELFRLLQRGRNKKHAYGYADDLVILEDSIEDMTESIEIIENFANALGLKLNTQKCKSIHIAPKENECLSTTFHINGEEVPYLLRFDATKYLGKPIGYSIFNDIPSLQDITDEGKRILNSRLAPWQKIDAMKTFFYPALNYAMRTEQFSKTDWDTVDKALRPLIKDTLHLPTTACHSYLYGNPKTGQLGIPVTSHDSDIARIDSAFKLLTSRDTSVRTIAWEDVTRAARDRTGSIPTTQEISEYMSGKEYPETSNRISSLWTRAREASTRLGLEWSITQDKKVTLLRGEEVAITNNRFIFRTLREDFKNFHSDKLSRYVSQGKTFECLSRSKASTHFHRTGDYLRFTDWNFIHSARLGLVKLNAYDRNNRDPAKKRCRRCGYALETLPHVLNHCKQFLHSKITERHDEIVERVRKASSRRWKTLKINQPYGRNRLLRPDLILTKDDEALILDVAMPFESSSEAFLATRKEKESKYREVEEDLKLKFKKVTTEAFIIGSLGSWDSKNDRVVRKLCTKRYARMFQKIVVSDAIKASNNLFWKFITDKEQRNDRFSTAKAKRDILPSELVRDEEGNTSEYEEVEVYDSLATNAIPEDGPAVGVQNNTNNNDTSRSYPSRACNPGSSSSLSRRDKFIKISSYKEWRTACANNQNNILPQENGEQLVARSVSQTEDLNAGPPQPVDHSQEPPEIPNSNNAPIEPAQNTSGQVGNSHNHSGPTHPVRTLTSRRRPRGGSRFPFNSPRNKKPWQGYKNNTVRKNEQNFSRTQPKKGSNRKTYDYSNRNDYLFVKRDQRRRKDRVFYRQNSSDGRNNWEKN